MSGCPEEVPGVDVRGRSCQAEAQTEAFEDQGDRPYAKSLLEGMRYMERGFETHNSFLHYGTLSTSASTQ